MNVANVYHTALLYLQNEAEADEITQDVFLKVFDKIETFHQDSKLSTWIYRITVNASLNRLKKNKRWSFVRWKEEEDIQVDFDHPQLLAEKKEDANLIFRAMQKLPDSQKTAFILSFIEEMPRQEVADVMETSLKAVESLLQRAKKNLRQFINLSEESEGIRLDILSNKKDRE
ncbi:RNA polymerase sigma factor [Putridiphycobacter roseus]|uniref:RNA polymerase sigma factor n=1 Tax=Putridiphycobacter roseus TaxID=2219161 RepID=UPI0021CE1529|nr:sigma-70 family RNA polymerase sigma factor [Putridiphycobacter roseus]